MELVKPAFGLIFWMFVSFGIILFLLKKFAWKPILEMLDEREKTISDALNSAQKAKEEMAALKAGNEKLLQEARNERDQLLKEARDAKETIINEAKTKANEEANKLLAIARENISNEKMAAITELKNYVATLSIEIAEKVLKQELADANKQKELVQSLLKDTKLN
ncbi:MAG: ATP synthase subunit b [Bacteroidia bacterium]|nr:ATP synthase subunit b [Bacteroidia bacterium]